MNSPQTAVIIPAFNAAGTLRACLQAITAQTCPPDDIIVVNDGSTDDTSAVAESVPGVRCVSQANAGPAAARNRGHRETQADIVLFTDADCIPAPDWVETALAGFRQKDVGAVAGSYDIINPQSRLARCIHQEIMYRHRHLMPAFPRSFGSYNVAIKSGVFAQVGGFDESYRNASGEDNDLSYKIRRAGHKIFFEPHCRVGHHHPEQVGRYLKEQFRHGFWRVKMYGDHPRMAGGDDYTFWKDIVEVGLACGIVASVAWGAFSGSWIIAVFLCAVMWMLQLWFGFRFCGRAGEAFFYAGVLSARAFYRALGFSTGIVVFLTQKKVKKK